MLGANLQYGNATRGSYTVEHHGNCILVFGSVPMSKFGALTKLVPKNSIMDIHLARISGASFAMGPKEETKSLVASMSDFAIRQAQARYAGMGLSDEAIRWLAVGHRGQSSNAMFFRLTGIKPEDMDGNESAYPHDPDDLGRCRLLLDQVPQLADRVGEMAGVSREWASLILAWNDLCRTMDEESPEWRNGKGRAPITSSMMEKCFSAAAA